MKLIKTLLLILCVTMLSIFDINASPITNESATAFYSTLGITETTPYDLELGYLVDKTVESDIFGTLELRTYVKPSLTRSESAATFTQTGIFYSSSNTINIKAKVYGNFWWDEAANTVRVTNQVGRILELSSNWTVSNEKVTTGSGGLFTKYASVTYSFKGTHSLGQTRSCSLTVKVNSKGELLTDEEVNM